MNSLERQVVSQEWLAMYFAPEWDQFNKKLDKVVFSTGYTKKEAFDLFCQLYRPNEDIELDSEELEVFAELNDSWFDLSEAFHKKHGPLKIFPDYYDPEIAKDADDLKGGFIGLAGAYVLHPNAERIQNAFVNHRFFNCFQAKHTLFFVEKS